MLRRRAGESLLIGDDIEIELLELTPQGAKIGIRAPRETVVLRKELKIIQEQNTRAARGLESGGLGKALKEFSRINSRISPRTDKHSES